MISILLLYSCSEDRDDNLTLQTDAKTTFSFTHYWDDTQITSSDFNTIQYTNANGETLSIETLRYLISDVTFTKENGEKIVIEGYNLVNLKTDTNLTYSPLDNIPLGTYTNVSFTFGFDAEDNIDGAYLDLNSESWAVPNTPMLGSVGGYHYMQLEGKFTNSTTPETGYAYHVIRAADGNTNPPTIEETFIEVDLGPITIERDINFEIKMNIAEWFKNTFQWDLTVWNTMLMPNFQAQLKMNQNGQNVFSLGAVTQ
ncbi:hypothetical protein N7U66_13990 [Lacinutrix neustonica]|uniref:Copper-binding protein MbnP-like domain-containing protein n=1 Tax=Lacinutrix neustonica TaxID=2980107 RepID=A0A9E8MVU9_9FLAO|nr:MbnP family protein [Lacinutrix neustonica]WAC01230.1 hypothetical protein N7U66_13990 [Lacinutrix neustonica]